MEIRLGKVAYYTRCLVALGQRDMNCGRSASKFWFCNFEVCSSLGSSAEESELKGQSVWLMIGRKDGIEVQPGYGEKTRSNVTAVGN